MGKELSEEEKAKAAIEKSSRTTVVFLIILLFSIIGVLSIIGGKLISQFRICQHHYGILGFCEDTNEWRHRVFKVRHAFFASQNTNFIRKQERFTLITY